MKKLENKLKLKLNLKKKFLVPFIIISIVTTSYFGSYLGIQSFINSELEKESDSDLIGISTVKILKLDENFITLNLTFILDKDEIKQNLEFQIKKTEIYYNSSLFGIVEIPDKYNRISTSQPKLSLILNFTINNKNLISQLIQDMIDGEEKDIFIKGSVKVLGIGAIYRPFTFEKKFTIKSTESETQDFFNIEFNSILISPEESKYEVNLTLSLTNPLDSTLNITNISGKITFDDLDGLGILAPKTNILISNFDLNWQDNPFELTANKTATKIIIHEDDIVDFWTASRLSDEYFNNQLKINIINAQITLNYKNGCLTIPFEIRNIVVPLIE